MTENLDLTELRAEVVEHGVLDYDQAQDLLDRVEAAERRLSAAVERKEICSLKLQDAEAAKQRVRDFHRPVEVETSATICHACSPRRGSGAHLRYFPYTEYPCATIRALDGGEQ